MLKFNLMVRAMSIMSEQDMKHQEQRITEILFSNTTDANKVQSIINQGIDPEVADEIVTRHMEGARAPVYYERIGFADFVDLDDEPDSSRPAA